MRENIAPLGDKALSKGCPSPNISKRLSPPKCIPLLNSPTSSSFMGKGHSLSV